MSDLLAAAEAAAEKRWPVAADSELESYRIVARREFYRGVEWVLAKLDRETVARAIALGVDGTDDYDARSVDYKDEMLAGADAVLALLGGNHD